jgi:hypothetical protein
MNEKKLYDFNSDDEYNKKTKELYLTKNSLLDEEKQVIKDYQCEINLLIQDTSIPQNIKDENIKEIKSIMSHKKTYYNELMANIEEQIKNYKKDYEIYVNEKKGYTWDTDNNETIKKWKVECDRNHFIYSNILDVLMKKSKQIKLVMIILTAIQSLIAISNLGISNDVSQTIIWLIKILTSVISTVSFILTQYLTLQKYDDDIKNITDYLINLKLFLKEITIISNIKNELRPNGDKYITDNEKTYLDIQSKSPTISPKIYQENLQSYDRFIKANKNKTYLV